jgi:hypothetical protein
MSYNNKKSDEVWYHGYLTNWIRSEGRGGGGGTMSRHTRGGLLLSRFKRYPVDKSCKIHYVRDTDRRCAQR